MMDFLKFVVGAVITAAVVAGGLGLLIYFLKDKAEAK